MKERNKSNFFLFLRIFVFLAFLSMTIITSFTKYNLDAFVDVVPQTLFDFDDVLVLIELSNRYAFSFALSIVLGFLFMGMLLSYYLSFFDKVDLKDIEEDFGERSKKDKNLENSGF